MRTNSQEPFSLKDALLGTRYIVPSKTYWIFTLVLLVMFIGALELPLHNINIVHKPSEVAWRKYSFSGEGYVLHTRIDSCLLSSPLLILSEDKVKKGKFF